MLFKKTRISEAAHRYQYALRRMPQKLSQGRIQNSREPVFQRLKVHLLLNLSRCKRKTLEYEESLKLAQQVLEEMPNNFEAHYAKAKTHREAGDLESAVQCLNEATRMAPTNRDAHRMLIRIKGEIRAEAEARAKVLLDQGGDSTSGVDSSGSTGSAKEEYYQDLNTSLVI